MVRRSLLSLFSFSFHLFFPKKKSKKQKLRLEADFIPVYPLPGQYFDLDDDLRVNYARFWLSLITPNSPLVQAQRRKYAKLVGNVGDDLYLILECESLHARHSSFQGSD